MTDLRPIGCSLAAGVLASKVVTPSADVGDERLRLVTPR